MIFWLNHIKKKSKVQELYFIVGFSNWAWIAKICQTNIKSFSECSSFLSLKRAEKSTETQNKNMGAKTHVCEKIS
jgi:hypothetical protein